MVASRGFAFRTRDLALPMLYLRASYELRPHSGARTFLSAANSPRSARFLFCEVLLSVFSAISIASDASVPSSHSLAVLRFLMCEFSAPLSLFPPV